MSFVEKLAQRLMDGLMSKPNGSLGGVWLIRLRRVLLRFSDPVVALSLGPARLFAHLSHNLPTYQKTHRLYDTALRRFLDFLGAELPAPRVIDVGANIGDTAVALLHGTECRILCIEGSNEFLELLDRNLAVYRDRAVVKRFFLGRESKEVAGELRSSAGTASLQSAGAADMIKILSLDDVLDLTPEFVAARVLKVDTDGYDCEVIRGAQKWITKSKPVIFMEFYPRLLQAVKADYMEVFDMLAAAGYDFVMYYANTGEYISAGRLSDGVASDIQTLAGKMYGAIYYDLFLFHHDDAALATRFHAQEQAFIASSGVKDRRYRVEEVGVRT